VLRHQPGSVSVGKQGCGHNVIIPFRKTRALRVAALSSAPVSR
jgi:hypothetical protein